MNFLRNIRLVRGNTIFCRRFLHGRFLQKPLNVEPALSNIDENVAIQGEGFRPHQQLTVRASMRLPEERFDHSAHIHIKTCSEGKFHLSTTESVGGFYKGCHPMGLFHTMTQCTDTAHDRFQLFDPLTSVPFYLDVHDGFKNDHFGHSLADTEIRRYVSRNEDVEVRKVCEGGLRGTVCVPKKGDGPHPAIIVLHAALKGMDGRKYLPEDVACYLASKGYVTFNLAYYGVDNSCLPVFYQKTHLEYFEKALNYLKSLEEVNSEKVGIYAHSKGGEIALSMASHLPGIRAVVLANGYICGTLGRTFYKGEVITEELPFDPSKVYFENGLCEGWNCFADPRQHQKAMPPFHRASADMMFVFGMADRLYRTEEAADLVEEKLAREMKTNAVVHRLPDLGHNVDLPNALVCPSRKKMDPMPYHYDCNFGGWNKLAHSQDTVRVWKLVTDFFSKSLS